MPRSGNCWEMSMGNGSPTSNVILEWILFPWLHRGAEVTGFDLSSAAIEKARQLNSDLQFNCQFVEANVLDIPDKFTNKFDIVFLSYGCLVWLDDLNKWGRAGGRTISGRWSADHGQSFIPSSMYLMMIFVEFHIPTSIVDPSLKKQTVVIQVGSMSPLSTSVSITALKSCFQHYNLRGFPWSGLRNTITVRTIVSGTWSKGLKMSGFLKPPPAFFPSFLAWWQKNNDIPCSESLHSAYCRVDASVIFHLKP